VELKDLFDKKQQFWQNNAGLGDGLQSKIARPDSVSLFGRSGGQVSSATCSPAPAGASTTDR
jgi:hypothetical protein